jgi:hypothetical protein
VSQLRIKFLATLPPGGPTHTVLLTDVPGLAHGTVLDKVSPAAAAAAAAAAYVLCSRRQACVGGW